MVERRFDDGAGSQGKSDKETMLIRNLTVHGFKSIMQEQPIELGRVNCFIGANGVGKSNLLEALGVLGAAANGVVDDESLLRRGVRAGVPRLYKSSFASERTPTHIGIEVSGALSECYRVSLLNPLESPSLPGSTRLNSCPMAATRSSPMGCGTKKILTRWRGWRPSRWSSWQRIIQLLN